MQRLKIFRYIAKKSIFFYLQLILFATIPLLGIRYLRINLFGSSFPIFFIFVITGISLFFFTKNYLKELKADKNTILFVVLLLMFSIFQLLNSFRVGSPHYSFDETSKTFSSLIVFVFIFYVLKNTIFNQPDSLKKLFIPLIFISTIILIVLIIRYYFHFNSKYLGIILEFRTETGKNQLALYLGMLFPVVLNTFLNKRNFYTFIYLIVHLIAVIYVDSRGVLLCLFLSYMFTFIFLKNQPRLQLITIFGLISILVFLVFNFVNNFSLFIDKMNSYNAVKDVHLYKSNEMREILATKSIYFFNSSPFFGIGTNNFLAQVGIVNHNSYLQILSEQGVVGFTFFLLLLIILFYVIKQLSKNCNGFEHAFIISSLVPIFYFTFINAYNFLLIYIFWAILFSLHNYHLRNDKISK